MSEINIDRLKDIFVDFAVKQAMGYLLKQAPWLFGFSPMGWIVRQVLYWLVKILVRETVLGTNLLLIEVHIDGRVGEMEDLLERLEQAETEEQRDAIEKEMVDVSRRLIRIQDDIRLRIKDS